MRAVKLGQVVVVAVLASAASALPGPVGGVGATGDAAGGQAETESLPLGPVPAPGPVAETGGDDRPLELSGHLRTVFALAFVVGLAVLGAAATKKLAKGRGGLLGSLGPGGPSPSGVIEILGRYPVGAGQTLVLLKLDRRVLLLHQTCGRRNCQMRTLSEVSDPEEVASILMRTRGDGDDAVQNGFRDAMQRLERDFSAYEPAVQSPARVTHATAEGDRVELLAIGSPGDDAGDLRSRLRRWIGEARA